MNKIDSDFILRVLKKPIKSIDKQDLIKLLYYDGDFTSIADLYVEYGVLNSITVDLLTNKASEEQVKLILSGNLPLSPEQIPLVVFLVLKFYKGLIRELYGFISNGGKILKKQLVQSKIFKDRYLIYLVKLLKNDDEFVTELIASHCYGEEEVKILVTSENGEVLFKISKLSDILIKNPDLMEELLFNPYLPDEAKIDLKQMIFEVKQLLENKDKSTDADEKEDDNNLTVKLEEDEIEEIENKVKTLAVFQKEEDEIEEELSNNLFIEITKMTMPQKMKLALKGNKTARTLLIKDANKQISLSVLKNPGITDEEIYQILKNRSTGEHIIRNIARNRVLMKDYNVVKNLVMHPKTPAEISIRLLNRLYINDLGIVAKSRDIPSNLRTTALRIYELKSRKK